MRHVIVLPDLGQTTTEARVIEWRKQPGEKVARGEPLLAVETDKVDMDVEAFIGGYLRRILVGPGSLAVALKPIAILTDGPDEPYEEVGQAGGRAPRVPATPAAKARLRALGLGSEGIAGSGPNGLVVRRDVARLTPPRESPGTRRLAGMAALVSASKRDIPHFYATVDAGMAEAESWRNRWNGAHPDLRASWNDVFMGCASRALKDTPELNVPIGHQGYRPSGSGHLLMVMANAEALSLVEVPEPEGGGWEAYLSGLRAAVRASAGPAKTGAGARPRPLLAVSNLGMFGVKEFAAIIPPGCSAALAIGAVRDAPVVRGGRIEAGRICTLTLSADHRIVDGIAAARFLHRMQRQLVSL
jgi:pyruvate dehydrogenase E2 component (dihydrolipoyllysine-residue acetyltransferase)